MNCDHLIIGGSAGAVSAVEGIRSVDTKASIIIVHDELIPAYSRPLISKFLAGEVDLGGISFRSSQFWNIIESG